LLFPVYPDLGPYPALFDDMLSGNEGDSPAAGKKNGQSDRKRNCAILA
jgi:hypothetical protein